jgi:GMP synthase-like glutamine amidotransferase
MTQNNMKPVIIFRFLGREGAGFLGDFLTAQNIPWQLHEIDLGKPAPASILGYSGMVLMGGPMSVNDDLPWIAPILALVREAKTNDIPVLGHCLGGQLMSKALGATITQNPIKEIGWGAVKVSGNETAKIWFGSIETFNAFHWHGETFALPAGAIHLLASQYCQNQAWSIGKHLAFQTHIEMTTEMVQKWCEEGAEELLESADSIAVQQASVMQESLPVHVFFLNKVANQVYTQWIKGLVV